MSDHRARYKNTGLNAKELRRRREEDSVQLRKQKRDDVLSKKRTLAPIDFRNDPIDDDETDLINNGNGGAPGVEGFAGSGSLPASGDMSEITETTLTPEMIQGLLQNDDMMRVLENAQKVRKMLSKEPQPPFDEVIDSGLIPRFVQLLDLDQNSLIQFEVAWILTNIASGTTEQTGAVVRSGALPKLVRLLSSNDIKVCEQAVWALGNIIGDCAEYRDLVISHQFLPALLNLINPKLEIGFLRNATWVLVNLCRNKEPPTDIEVIRQLLPALLSLIETDDQMILIDTTWAVSYIAELGSHYSQLIIDSGIVKKMVPLLTHHETKIQTAAIRALGCITTGSDEQTQAVIDAGAIPHLRALITNNKDKIVKEALWFISNITAGSANQIQEIINGDIIPTIIRYLSVGDYHQQKEASWTIFNYCLSGSEDQLRFLIDHDVIPALCDLLPVDDPSLIKNVLEAIISLLKTCDNESDHTVRDLIESCGGLDRIEALQNSENQEIYQHAFTIIDNYFSAE